MKAGLTNVAQLFVAVFEGVTTRDDAITDQAETDEVEAIDGLAVDESRQYKQKKIQVYQKLVGGGQGNYFFCSSDGWQQMQGTIASPLSFLVQKTA